jgi:tRNA pseudouridine38-40 synthase
MENALITARWALGIEYNGQAFYGWQSQPHGQTIQDHLEKALSNIACEPISVICAGRTDTGVHGLNQVVHFDTTAKRLATAWVRGVNRYLPDSIRICWATPVSKDFHARFSAFKRSYRYVLYTSIVRPALYYGNVGWIHDSLDESLIRQAISLLIGEHDFSAFRASRCQAKTPVKTMYDIRFRRKGDFWIFDFDASGFLHHMIRNIMGTLIAVGKGQYPVDWVTQLLNEKNRVNAAPTFSAEGLYFIGVEYPEPWQFPKPAYLPFD